MTEYLRKQETKTILKFSSVIGLAFLSIFVLPVQLRDLYIILIKVLLNTNEAGAIEAINSSYVSAATYSIVLTSISFIVPFVLITKLFFREKISNVISTDKPKCSVQMLLCLFVLSLGFCYVGNQSSHAVSLFMDNVFGVTPVMADFPDAVNWFDIIFSVVSIAIIPALLEEFAFRGAILGFLKRFGKINAIIISSILFAIMHGNFVQIPFAFFVGLALGFITIATDSIWPAIIVHAFNNFLSIVVSYYPNLYYLLFICFIFGISVLVYLIINKPFADAFKEGVFYNSNAKRFSLIIFNPVIIIGIAFFIYEACSMVR